MFIVACGGHDQTVSEAVDRRFLKTRRKIMKLAESRLIAVTIGTLSIGKLAIQLTIPLLLRKPCKLFASVARVCQRQLGFLVTYGLELK